MSFSKLYRKSYNAWRSFNRNHLTLVQACQTGVLMGTGDMIAQTVIEKKGLEHIDWIRTMRFSALGCFFVGPSLSTWYQFLTRTLGDSSKGGALVTVKKVACDQLFFAPGFIGVFIAVVNFVERHNWQTTKEQFRTKYKDIVLSNYKIWPAVQLANFYFVPLRHQVLVAQCVGVIWNCYLSWKTHK